MKQETKDLLEDIISAFNERRITGNFPTEKKEAEVKRFNEKQQKIQDFLRSIPDIEKHLTEGGYIQDKNGTPICHGDKVSFCKNIKEKFSTEGFLLWNPDKAMFEIAYDVNEQAFDVINFTEIPRTFVEKVKNEKAL